MSLTIQVKLLRVMERMTFKRVGGTRDIKVDLRIISATNRDLAKAVREGTFREDLYYRLKVVEIVLPTLRERKEDIELLVIHFCDLFNKKFGKNIEGVTDDVLDTFMRYPWPGNIRELEHAIEHAFVLCHENVIALDHIPSEIKDYRELPDKLSGSDESDETRKITDTLKQAEWNKAKAARLLGISRQTLYRKMKEKNIQEYVP